MSTMPASPAIPDPDVTCRHKPSRCRWSSLMARRQNSRSSRQPLLAVASDSQSSDVVIRCLLFPDPRSLSSYRRGLHKIIHMGSGSNAQP